MTVDETYTSGPQPLVDPKKTFGPAPASHARLWDSDALTNSKSIWGASPGPRTLADAAETEQSAQKSLPLWNLPSDLRDEQLIHTCEHVASSLCTSPLTPSLANKQKKPLYAN